METLGWPTILVFLVELLLVIPSQVYSILVICRVCTDGSLHFPFRACLTLICFRIYPHSLQFGAEAIGRWAVYGPTKKLPYQNLLDALEILEVYGTAFTQLALAIERIVAILDGKYEKRFAEIWKKVLFLIALYSPAVFMSVEFTILGYHSTGKTARFLLLAAYLLSFSTMLFTFRSSLKSRLRRHTLMLELGKRYSTIENLKASSLYLPILVNELVCEGIKTFLVYLVAPSNINNYILDTITAYQCLFYSAFLFHRHRRIMSKASQLSIFKSSQATENYFSSYAAAWR